MNRRNEKFIYYQIHLIGYETKYNNLYYEENNSN